MATEGLFSFKGIMNTFLPYPDFKQSAKVLDMQRLGKQRVEGLYLLHVMLEKKVVKDIKTGPRVIEFEPKTPTGATKLCIDMWDHTINALGIYTLVMCEEWSRQGYFDTIAYDIKLLIPGISEDWKVKYPTWLGDPDFHKSMRSNLTRKDPIHYGKYWDEPNNLPYIWPKGK